MNKDKNVWDRDNKALKESEKAFGPKKKASEGSEKAL